MLAKFQDVSAQYYTKPEAPSKFAKVSFDHLQNSQHSHTFTKIISYIVNLVNLEKMLENEIFVGLVRHRYR